MKPEERRESDEELLARIAARHKARQEAAKPKVTLNVSPKVAEAVKANPEGVRVAVTTDDGPIVERAKPLEVVEVLEVRDGRPVVVRRHDFSGRPHSEVWPEEVIYRPGSGAVHQYNPLDALRSGDDD